MTPGPGSRISKDILILFRLVCLLFEMKFHVAQAGSELTYKAKNDLISFRHAWLSFLFFLFYCAYVSLHVCAMGVYVSVSMYVCALCAYVSMCLCGVCVCVYVRVCHVCSSAC